LYPFGLFILEAGVMSDIRLALSLALSKLRWQMATAESCTGGLIAAHCTDLPGSSQWFDRGFVTYSNASKTDLLGVSPDLIKDQGAVSEAVALAMALGVVDRSAARASLAVTGIAGPDGGSADKPVGCVWFAWCLNGDLSAERLVLPGNRQQVRHAACAHALQGLGVRLSKWA
jgi:nicotinamide-nucleotide amidase